MFASFGINLHIAIFYLLGKYSVFRDDLYILVNSLTALFGRCFNMILLIPLDPGLDFFKCSDYVLTFFFCKRTSKWCVWFESVTVDNFVCYCAVLVVL